MFKGRNPLDIFRRKALEPKIYLMSCGNCDFSEQFELENKSLQVCHNPELDHSQEPQMLAELPKLCPKCGAKLKKTRVPVKIRY